MRVAVTLSVLLGAAALPGSSGADEVWRWQDADGTWHFSDTMPPDEIEALPVALVETRRDYDPASDPYSILNQASRIHEAWLEIAAPHEVQAEAETETRNDAARAAAARAAQVAPLAGPAGGYTHYGSRIYLPVPTAITPGPHPARLARQQRHALDVLDLWNGRPSSINSTAHRERVERSQALPHVPAPPRSTPASSRP